MNMLNRLTCQQKGNFHKKLIGYNQIPGKYIFIVYKEQPGVISRKYIVNKMLPLLKLLCLD